MRKKSLGLLCLVKVKEDAFEVGMVHTVDNIRSGKRGEVKTEEDISSE